MAPEQILCCGQVTASADLYSLGTLLFRAVTGAHVFGPGLDRLELVRTKLTTEAPPLPTDRQDPFARGFVKVLARALERNPRERYSSADELRADLSRLRDLPAKSAARAASPDASAAKPARAATRVARRYVLSAVMVMTLVAVIIGGSWIGRSDSSASSSAAPPPGTSSATAAPDRP
jgi:serine/threonine-protein kinase